MAEKNLPIKFFQKRQKDEQDTEGGGGKLPKWVNADSVGEKSIYIRHVLGDISQSLARRITMCHQLSN
jgi:hypothetical protein